MKAQKQINAVEFFEELDNAIKDLIKECILEAAYNRGGPEGWKSDEECLDSIECHSRDGFIASAHNRGGITYRNFATLMGYWGGGYTCSHGRAAKEIERQIDYSFDCVSEQTFEKFKDVLEAKNLSKSDCNYVRMTELKEQFPEEELFSEIVSYIEDGEMEFLGGEESSIMHEFRFMYHGSENGIHSASVSAAINTEGPYHRSSISWAPEVFCEGSKEVEITWKTAKELENKLKAALNETSKAVF